MNKTLVNFLVAMFVLVGSVFWFTPAYACYRTTCRGIDPNASTDQQGLTCAATALTVKESTNRTSAGTNGTVTTDLRWSRGCESNWARGSISGANSYSKYLYAKVWENAAPVHNYYQYIYGTPLINGNSVYTNMVDGDTNKVSVAFAGISSVSWTGPYNPSLQYSG